MTKSLTVTAGDFTQVGKDILAERDKAATSTMDQVATGLKGDLRRQTQAAGLGRGVANAWQGQRYPKSGTSGDPSAFVWSKAPKIIEAFDAGATIRTVHGRKFLAIPTENVPRKATARGASRKMTPQEVEDTFNQDLHFERTANGKILAYVNVVGAKSGKGFRPATKGRTKQGRTTQPVVMFVLVPTVNLQKRLDVAALAEKWAGQVEGLFAQNWK